MMFTTRPACACAYDNLALCPYLSSSLRIMSLSLMPCEFFQLGLSVSAEKALNSQEEFTENSTELRHLQNARD